MQSSHSPKTTEPVKFMFGDVAMPLRIATVAVAGVFAFIAFAGTIRYEVSQPKTNTSPSQNSDVPVSETPNTNQTTNPNINQPQTGTGTNNSAATARCNTSQKSAYTSQYNAQVAQENARHTSQINFLTSTGASAAAFGAENNIHNANLNSIATQYQNNLRSISC